MTSKTRKHIWPAALVMSIAIIGVVAAFVVLAASPGSSSAHDGDPHDCSGMTPIEQAIHDAFAGEDEEKCADSPTETPTPTDTPGAMGDVMVTGWSSSSNGSDQLIITVRNAGELDIDDSIVLVLEDDFNPPDSVPNGAVFFKQTGFPSHGARVYASVEVDSEDDGHAGDDAHTIRIYVPDMSPDDSRVAGLADADFAIIIPKPVGIKNPGDAKNYGEDNAGFKVGYQILRGTATYDDEATMALPNVVVKPKVSLDDENNKRGYMLTIAGTGFNKGSSATAYVLKDQSAAPESCAALIAHDDSESIGSGTVGDDYKVEIEAEVTGGSKGDFSPGKTNYICVRDDNSPDRRLSSDTDLFDLQHSIAVEPDSVASGEEVTVKLRDYVKPYSVTNVSLDGKKNSDADDFDIDSEQQRHRADLRHAWRRVRYGRSCR